MMTSANSQTTNATPLTVLRDRMCLINEGTITGDKRALRTAVEAVLKAQQRGWVVRPLVPGQMGLLALSKGFESGA